MKLVTLTIYMETRSIIIHAMLMSLCSTTLFNRVCTLRMAMNKLDYVQNHTMFILTT